jgi:hypothetical protein
MRYVNLSMHNLRMKKMKIPIRYLPLRLTRKDRQDQSKMLNKSKIMYRTGKYYTREKLPSFKSKPSKHVATARKMYDLENILPDKNLSRKTGCSVNALNRIVEKGMGAYYSSGSRPNQTAHSWGLARLASSITGGKSAAVDYAILEDGCNHRKPAFILANKSVKRYNHGQSKTRKIAVNV